MITKIDIVLAAYDELMISGLTSKATPEEITIAVKKLDTMIAGWKNKNLCLSYIPSVSYSDIDPNQDSGINDTDMFAVVANLAKNLCSTFGKICNPQTIFDAKEGYDNLFSVIAPERESNPYQPIGSGSPYGSNYGYRYRYQPEDKNAPSNCQTLNLKVGQTDFFSIDFTRYLLEDNVIASYTIEDGQGVSIPTSAQANGIISIEAIGLTAGFSPVKITITSSPSGRIDPQTINFNVTAT